MAAMVVSIFEGEGYSGHIQRAAEVLNQGGIVVVPTETVYGAAVRLDHPEALTRLKGLREGAGGNASKPLTVHLGHRDEAPRYLGEVGDLGRRMMKKLWPGPVALVFDVPAQRRAEVAGGLRVAESEIYDGPSITLRCPDHQVARDVIGAAHGPVVATAAGGAGTIADSAKNPVAQLAVQLEGKVDLILDAGPTSYSKPSTIVRVWPDRYEVVRSGVYDERIIERLLKTTILFVCSGNTCRSPMAEALAKRIISEKLGTPVEALEARGINVLSAGSSALSGAPAATNAVAALKDRGADLARHRSRPLTVELIHQADRIYTMSRDHSRAVTALVPSAAEKVATLDPAGDIDDPIGADMTTYQVLAGQLTSLIEKRLDETILG